MVDFQVNLFTVIFGTLIFGLGYIGLLIRYKLLKKDFYQLKLFDKIIQSFILGTFSFILTTQFGLVKVVQSSEQEMLGYVMIHPEIFFIQLFFVGMMVYYFVIIEMFIQRIPELEERVNKWIKEFRMKKEEKPNLKPS
jgi:hypothetical protein